MSKPVVGEVVHYVASRGVCRAAIITGACEEDTAHLSVFRDCAWQKQKFKADVSHSEKPLRRTWHRLEECTGQEGKDD